MDKAFDPTKHVDATKETEKFVGLIGFGSDKRILAIEEKRSGYGKTSLLKKFRYICRTAPKPVPVPVPVSLISLDEVTPPTPFELIKLLVSDLKQDLTFENFGRVINAIEAKDLSAISGFSHSAAPIRGSASVDTIASGASDTKIAGIMNIVTVEGKNLDLSKLLPTATLSEEDIAYAHRTAEEVFFDDLIAALENHAQGAVLLFDTYEKADNELKTWLMKALFEPHFFRAKKLKRLAIVVAGQSCPAFHLEFPQPELDRLVIDIKELSKWTEQDVEQALINHELQPIPEVVTGLHSMMHNLNVSPLNMLNLIQSTAHKPNI